MTAGGTWLRFNLVGIIGFGVQALVLWGLVARFGVPAPLAIVLAVLAAVSHNFAWHERFTWPGSGREGRLRRWLGFNATTGAMSVAANLVLTGLIGRATGLPIVIANGTAVALLSLVTFLVSDRVIFRARVAADDRGGDARLFASGFRKPENLASIPYPSAPQLSGLFDHRSDQSLTNGVDRTTAPLNRRQLRKCHSARFS